MHQAHTAQGSLAAAVGGRGSADGRRRAEHARAARGTAPQAGRGRTRAGSKGWRPERAGALETKGSGHWGVPASSRTPPRGRSTQAEETRNAGTTPRRAEHGGTGTPRTTATGQTAARAGSATNGSAPRPPSAAAKEPWAVGAPGGVNLC